jgi:hypothetical protein
LKQQAEAIATQLERKLRFEPALPLKVLKKVDAAKAARRQAKELQERGSQC